MDNHPHGWVIHAALPCVPLISKQIKEPPLWVEGETRLQALCDGLSAAVSY